MINKWIFIAMKFSHFSFFLILTNSSFLALFSSLSYAAPWPPTLVSPQLQSGFFFNFYYCDFLFSFTIWSNNRDSSHTRPRGRGWGDRHTHLWEVWCNVAWKAKRSQVSWPMRLVELNYFARMPNYLISSKMKKLKVYNGKTLLRLRHFEMIWILFLVVFQGEICVNGIYEEIHSCS